LLSPVTSLLSLLLLGFATHYDSRHFCSITTGWVEDLQLLPSSENEVGHPETRILLLHLLHHRIVGVDHLHHLLTTACKSGVFVITGEEQQSYNTSKY
jgi:hypothetical protein